MKISSFCALFLLVVFTAFMFTTSASLFPEYGDKPTLIPGGRKLKESHVSIRNNNNGDASRVTLNDYGNDQTPTMEHVEKGPIEHESPLIPYIPKLPPPPGPGSRGNPVQEIPGNSGNIGDYN